MHSSSRSVEGSNSDSDTAEPNREEREPGGELAQEAREAEEQREEARQDAVDAAMEAAQQADDDNPAADGEGGKPKLPRPVGVAACPRCHSEETKFCYYNNYNLKQPRYFCKA